MYCCRANSFSSRDSCSLVKLVRIRFDFPPLLLKECAAVLTLDMDAAKTQSRVFNPAQTTFKSSTSHAAPMLLYLVRKMRLGMTAGS